MKKITLFLLFLLFIPFESFAFPTAPQPGGTGDLVSTNNLSDVSNTATALGNLGGAATTDYGCPSLSDTDGQCLSSAPTPVAGRCYCADNEAAGWEPIASVTGTANYLVLYDGASYIGLWDEDGNMLVSKVTARIGVNTDNDGHTFAASDLNQVWRTSGAFDYNIPTGSCDAANEIGTWVTLKATAAVIPSLTSNDASDVFVLSDGTALTAGDELDLGGAAGNQCYVVCVATNTWEVFGEIGTCSDGGVAD